MRKMKRGLSLVLASIMATALVGCSGGENTETTNTATTTENKETTGTTQVADENQEEITLRFVSWQTNHDEQNQKVAAAYKELHPNINVQFDYVGDMNSNDYLTKTDIMLMGGEAMDILMAPNYASYIVRAESGSYLSLDDYFTEEGTTAEDAYNVIVRVNDQTYGIPGEMKYNLVLINKDMLDAAGLDVPSLDWTWDDYREYAEKLTSGSGADTKYGSYFHSWGSCNLWGISSGKGGSTIFNDDKTLTFDNPNLAKFLQLRYDMENVDHSSTPLADVKALNMNYRDQFFNGNIAMLPMGTAMLSDIGNEKYAHDFVTTFARQPLWDKDGEHYNEAGGNIFSIAKTSEHPKEAYDFLRFWTTEGVDIKGMFISNEKGAVKSDSVKQIIAGFEDKLDTDTLTKIMDDPDWVDSYGTYIPDYQSEIDNILTEETDKYLVAIAQSSPGAIAVNGAIVVGYKLAGAAGIFVAILGTVLPPFVILSVISIFYNAFRNNWLISQLLEGMQAGVGAVIASVTVDMGLPIIKEKDPLSLVIMVGAFIAACVFSINVVYIVLTCGIIGVIRTLLSKRRSGK